MKKFSLECRHVNRGCQICMQGPQLCPEPCHFCKLDVATSRMAFLDLNLHVPQLKALSLQYKIATLTPPNCMYFFPFLEKILMPELSLYFQCFPLYRVSLFRLEKNNLILLHCKLQMLEDLDYGNTGWRVFKSRYKMGGFQSSHHLTQK